MTTAGICTIGDEILIGQIVDTNSAMISRELGKAGVRVREMVSVGDSEQEIYDTVSSMLERNDIVIVTGGLGPTKDDVTKNVLFRLSGSKEYVRNGEQLAIIRRILASRGLDVLDNNIRQASVPEKCHVIPNRLGTAPVMSVTFPEEKFGHKATLYSLPGVPFEAAGVIPDVISDIRDCYSLSGIHHKTIMTYGIAESALAGKISGWENALPECVHLAYLPDPLKGVALRMSVYGEASDAETVFSQQSQKLKEILGTAIYAEKETTLQEVIGEMLINRGKTVSTAESCTGGRIASLITSVPGSSAYYPGSLVSYAVKIKENLLGVPSETIDRYGVVSSECAAAMAERVRKLTGSDYAISTTGVAGPDGGSEDSPVGTVWIGVCSDRKTETARFNYRNDRLRNIERFAASALDTLRKFILSENA